MSITKITFSDKEALQNDESVARKNKVTDSDMNEIKEAINNNADELKQAEKDILTFKSYTYKGTVDTLEELTTLEASVGDIYKVTEEDKNYIYDGENWIEYTMKINIESITNQVGTVIIDSGTTITNGYEVTLPLYYQVGNNSLELRAGTETLILATDDNDGHYKEVGDEGELSSTIAFYRTDSDGDWTLTEDLILVCVVKGVS